MGQPFTYDQAIKLFELQQQAILAYQRDMAKTINAKTISEVDRVSEKMDEMIERQDKSNDNIAKNVTAIGFNNKTTEKVNRISKNIKWYILGLFGFCYVTAWFYDRIDFLELILMLFKKV